MTIITETTEGVARIEIARPEKKNALTTAMYQQLADALTAAQADPAVHAVLMHGQPDLFTAGNDLEDFLKNPPPGPGAPLFQFMRALAHASKPVVAAVNGAAVGIGTTLLMHCDLVYCADNAMFSMPFVSLGLCPEFASSVLIAQSAGYHKAAEKLLLGEPISAEEALEMRIVNRLLPPTEVRAYAQRQALRFATLPPTAVCETKRLIKTPKRAAVDAAIEEEAQSFGKLLVSAEAKEAFNAFLGKRKPNFVGH